MVKYYFADATSVDGDSNLIMLFFDVVVSIEEVGEVGVARSHALRQIVSSRQIVRDLASRADPFMFWRHQDASIILTCYNV